MLMENDELVRKTIIVTRAVRKKVGIIMGVIMLVCIVTLLFFGLPVGLLLCGMVGLGYGVLYKDRLFVRWSAVALAANIAFWICFCIGLQNM